MTSSVYGGYLAETPFEWLDRRVTENGITLHRTDQIPTGFGIDIPTRTIWIRDGLSWAAHHWAVCRGVAGITFPDLMEVAQQAIPGGAKIIPMLRRPW